MSAIRIISVLLMVLVPASVSAYTYSSGSESNVSTGGVTAGSGQVVVTGDSEASAEIKTHINNNGSGTSVVHIESDSGGSVHGETITKIITNGVVSTTSTKTTVKAKTGARLLEHQRIATTSTPAMATASTSVNVDVTFTHSLASLFARLFSFFRFK